jgi:hypothetical protein
VYPPQHPLVLPGSCREKETMMAMLMVMVMVMLIVKHIVRYNIDTWIRPSQQINRVPGAEVKHKMCCVSESMEPLVCF